MPQGTAVYLWWKAKSKEPVNISVIRVCREGGSYNEHIENALTIESFFRSWGITLGTRDHYPERFELALDVKPHEGFELLRDASDPKWIAPHKTCHYNPETKRAVRGHGRGPTIYQGDYKRDPRVFSPYEEKDRFDLRMSGVYGDRRAVSWVKDIHVQAEPLMWSTLRFSRLKPKALRKYHYPMALLDMPVVDALLEIKPEHRPKVKEPLPVNLRIERETCIALNNVATMTAFTSKHQTKQKVKLSETKTDTQQKQAFMQWVKGKYGNESTTIKEVTGKSALGTPGEKTIKPTKARETRS